MTDTHTRPMHLRTRRDPELLDPRPVTDPAWGGVIGTRDEVAQVGFGEDSDLDRFGEEPHGRFQETLDDPGERVRGRRWRSRRMRARDVMTARPHAVSPDATVTEISEIMVAEDCGIVPVVDEGRLVGVVTDRDIVCRVVARGLDQRTAQARDVMSDELAAVEERANLADVLRQMERHQVRRVCVVREDDRLVGIVSMADLAREADVDYELQDAFLEISSDRSFWSRLR